MEYLIDILLLDILFGLAGLWCLPGKLRNMWCFCGERAWRASADGKFFHITTFTVQAYRMEGQIKLIQLTLTAHVPRLIKQMSRLAHRPTSPYTPPAVLRPSRLHTASLKEPLLWLFACSTLQRSLSFLPCERARSAMTHGPASQYHVLCVGAQFSVSVNQKASIKTARLRPLLNTDRLI